MDHLPAPASVQEAEAWRQRLAALLEEHGDGIVLVEVAVSREQAALGVFAVKLAATEARSARSAIRIALGGSLVDDAAALAAVYTADLAPYIDMLVVSDVGAESARRVQARVDFSATLAVAGRRAAWHRWRAPPHRCRCWTISAAMCRFGRGTPRRPVEDLRALAPIASLLKSEISRLDAAAAKLRLSIGDRDVTGTHRFRMLFDERTFATYLVYWGDAPPDALQVAATLSMGGAAVVRDLLKGTEPPPATTRATM